MATPSSSSHMAYERRWALRMEEYDVGLEEVITSRRTKGLCPMELRDVNSDWA
eukprot:CAMPEP_0196184140 /NCGR_PEP_ID=MMETSP0911-20130528/33264_1 /TAXON_ID=49265 /ORGANISM="Thalassiosira rotula, Strain GSO102" /LENGTH=52 /DNA_ID=CAMNT_0041454241 /DNA_START=20 /DNA_END=178 /DNA_ORIENTATION=-